MTSQGKRDFQVRHLDCDVQGHMYATNYIGLVEEVTYEALLEVASPNSTDLWTPQALYIQHKVPLIDGAIARVEPEFSRKLNGELISKCKIINASTGEHAAYVEAWWNNEDSPSTRVGTESTAIGEAHQLEESFQGQLVKAMKLALPKLPDQTVKFFRKVEVRDVDQSATATFKALADYMVEAGVRGAEEIGWSIARMREAGFGFVVREQWIHCLSRVSLRDEIEVATWVSDFKRVSGARNYELKRVEDASPVMKARTIWACVNISTGSPARIPPEFLNDISPHMSS